MFFRKGIFQTLFRSSQSEQQLEVIFKHQCQDIQEWAKQNSISSNDQIVNLEKNLVDIIKYGHKQEELEQLKQISMLQNIQEINDQIRSLASEVQLIKQIIQNCQEDDNKIDQSKVQFERQICTLCYAIKNLKTIYAVETPIQMMEFIDTMNKSYAKDLSLQAYQIDKEIKELFKPFSTSNPKYVQYCQEFLSKNQINQNNIYQSSQQSYMSQGQGLPPNQNWAYQSLQTPTQVKQNRSEQLDATQYFKDIIGRHSNSQNNLNIWAQNNHNTSHDYKMTESIYKEKVYEQQEYCSNYGNQQDIIKIIQQINKKNLRDPMQDYDHQQIKHPEQSQIILQIENQYINNPLI